MHPGRLAQGMKGVGTDKTLAQPQTKENQIRKPENKRKPNNKKSSFAEVKAQSIKYVYKANLKAKTDVCVCEH